jgi:hypothetical protein
VFRCTECDFEFDEINSVNWFGQFTLFFFVDMAYLTAGAFVVYYFGPAERLSFVSSRLARDFMCSSESSWPGRILVAFCWGLMTGLTSINSVFCSLVLSRLRNTSPTTGSLFNMGVAETCLVIFRPPMSSVLPSGTTVRFSVLITSTIGLW